MFLLIVLWLQLSNLGNCRLRFEPRAEGRPAYPQGRGGGLFLMQRCHVVALSRADIEDQARQLLKEHGLYKIPVDPVILANHLGVKVNNAKFSEGNLSGMVARRGTYVQILVNQADQPYRKRFTIAHEIGHYLLHLREGDGEFADHETDLFRLESGEETHLPSARSQEIEANRFASALLMDEDLVRGQWPAVRSVKAMARLFNVSESAMGIRVGTLGLE